MSPSPVGAAANDDDTVAHSSTIGPDPGTGCADSELSQDPRGPIVISRGGPVTSSSARRLSCLRTAAELAALLDACAEQHELEPWWCTAVWRGDMRTAIKWEFADIVAIEADHITKRPNKRPVNAAERAELDAILMSLPGNVAYYTPRGLRLIAILQTRNADAELHRKAQAGFSAIAAKALATLTWLQVDAGVTTAALSQPLYCPRGNSKGPGTHVAAEHPQEAEPGPRNASCIVLREEPYSVADLAALAPPEPVTTPQAPKKPAAVTGPRPARAASTIDEAVATWNRDHPPSYTIDKRQCPVCQHFGCFGPMGPNPERWHCYSSDHPGDIGRPAPSGMGFTGDALDIEAFRRGRTRIEVLREDGYLEDVWFDASSGEQAGPNPNAIVVHDIAGAQAQITNALHEWPIGKHPLEIAGAAGSGKTTAATNEFIARVRAGSLQIGIIALHTAALVREKAERAREIIGADSLAVIELLGARPNDSLGFWCEEPERRAEAAEIGLFACSGCPLLKDETCESTPGRYRHDALAALAKIKSTAGALVFTTHARAPQLLDELARAGLFDRCAIVIDDDGSPCSGLLRETELDADIADAALEHVGSHAGRTALAVAWHAWDSWLVQYASACYAPLLRHQQPHGPIADVACRVLSAIVATATANDGRPVAESQPLAAVATELRAQHPTFADALVSSVVPGSTWTWELPLSDDGPDHRPALTRELLRLLAIELAGHSVTVVPVVRNPKRPHVIAWKFRAACLPLARAAAEGRVCFLSVGPLPRAVVEWLGIRSVLLESEPTIMTTLQLNGYLFGTRKPQPALVLAIWTALYDAAKRPGGITLDGTSYRAPGAILRKRDRATLKETHPAAYHASGHYGRAHAATDAFADCDLMFVSRTSLPPGTSEATARALAAAFPAIIAEAPDRAAALTALGNDIRQSWRRQHMLNAVGRLRGLSATRQKLAVVADGEEVPGLFVDEDWTIGDLIEELGLDGGGIRDATAAIQAAKQQSKTERDEAQAQDEAAEDRAREVLRTEAVKIAAEWWQLCHSPITAKDLGEILAGRGFKLTRAELRELRAELVASDSQFGAEMGSISTRAHFGADLGNVPLPTAANLVQRAGVSQSTAYRVLSQLRGWLDGGPAPTLGRSDLLCRWLTCARAIRELMIDAGTWEAIADHPFALLTEDDDGRGPSHFGRTRADRSPGSSGSGEQSEQQQRTQSTTGEARGRRSRRRAAQARAEAEDRRSGAVGSMRQADLVDSAALQLLVVRLPEEAIDDRIDDLTDVGQEFRGEEVQGPEPLAPRRRERSRSRRSCGTWARGHRAPLTPRRLRDRASNGVASSPHNPHPAIDVARSDRSNSDRSDIPANPKKA